MSEVPLYIQNRADNFKFYNALVRNVFKNGTARNLSRLVSREVGSARRILLLELCRYLGYGSRPRA